MFGLFPFSLILFGIMLVKKRLLRFPDIKLVLIAISWVTITYLLNLHRTSILQSFTYYTNLCVIAFLCYSFAYATSQEHREKFLRKLIWFWTIPIILSAIVALIFVFTGTTLFRTSDLAPMGIVNGRLWFICDPNMYGLLCCMAICLILYLMLCRYKTIIKVLLILSGFILLTALSLTDSRTSKYALLVAAFFFIVIVANNLLKKRKHIVRLFISIAISIVLCAMILLSFRVITDGSNFLMSKFQRVASSAAIRDYSNTTTVDQRFGIWRFALSKFSQEKDVWLRGATPALSHQIFLNPATQYNHLHNSYLSVLLGFGVPGFILMVAFLVYLITSLCKLLFSRQDDLAIHAKFLPIIILPILACGFMEEILFTCNFVSHLDVWLAIIGSYCVVVAREQGARNKNTKVLAEV